MQIKLLLIGDSGVGKTCLLKRYSEDIYSTTFITTIGIDFKIKNILLNNKRIKLQIWDTAGQERFRTITTSYFRGAQGVLIIYDVTDRNTFESVRNWIAQTQMHAALNVVVMIVANKSDAREGRCVSYDEGEQLAKQYDAQFYEVSAKQDLNVERCFISLATDVMYELLSPPVLKILKVWSENAILSKDGGMIAIRWQVSQSGRHVKYHMQIAPKAYFLQWKNIFTDSENSEWRYTPRDLTPGGCYVVRLKASRKYQLGAWSDWSEWSEPFLFKNESSDENTAPPNLEVSPSFFLSMRSAFFQFFASEWRSHWKAPHLSHCCDYCGKAFSLFVRKHHCRKCGNIFCKNCIPPKSLMYVEVYGREVRTCVCCIRVKRREEMIKASRELPPDKNFIEEGVEYLKTLPGLTIKQLFDQSDSTERYQVSEGATSFVFHGSFHGIPVAIKLYKQSFIILKTKDTVISSALISGQHLSMESYTYEQVKACPHIVKLLFSRLGANAKHPFIATELLAENGTLTEVLNNPKISNLSWLWKLKTLKQVAEALVWLHKLSFTHGDLKADNILVKSINIHQIHLEENNSSREQASEDLVRLFDLNSCDTFGTKTYDDLDNMFRTITHAAPEILQFLLDHHQIQASGAQTSSGGDTSSSVHKIKLIESKIELTGAYDIYSFGILMAEIARHGVFYMDEDALGELGQLEDAIIHGERPLLRGRNNIVTSSSKQDNPGSNIELKEEDVEDGYIDDPDCSPTLDEEMVDHYELPAGYEVVAAQCWNQDSSKRPTAIELVEALDHLIESEIEKRRSQLQKQRENRIRQEEEQQQQQAALLQQQDHLTDHFHIVCDNADSIAVAEEIAGVATEVVSIPSSITLPVGELIPPTNEPTTLPTPINSPTHKLPVTTPDYLVVLKDSSFLKSKLPTWKAISKAQRLEKAVVGLKAYHMNQDKTILDDFIFQGPENRYELQWIYKRHPGNPKKYIPVNQFATEMLKEKEAEFVGIMSQLGAKRIHSNNQSASKNGFGIQGGVFTPIGISLTVKGESTTTNDWERDCSCQFENPFGHMPSFEEDKRYLFYPHEPEWKSIKESRVYCSNPMVSTSLTFKLSTEDFNLASVEARVREFGGLLAEGVKYERKKVVTTYTIEFFTIDDYQRHNCVLVSQWTPLTVQTFLERINMQEYNHNLRWN